jgi:hypothetical protein
VGPASGAVIATIRTLAWVRTLALAPPDHCVIGAELGLVSIRVQPADPCPDAVVTLPSDARGARHCPVHAQHVQVREIDGEPVLRVCIKGLQLSNPRYSELSYPFGHCYVVSGRIVVGPDQPEWRTSLVLWTATRAAAGRGGGSGDCVSCSWRRR